MSFSVCYKSRCLFVPSVNPFDATTPTYIIRYSIEAVTYNAVNRGRR
jgi:hypothetical protein